MFRSVKPCGFSFWNSISLSFSLCYILCAVAVVGLTWLPGVCEKTYLFIFPQHLCFPTMGAIKSLRERDQEISCQS